MKELPEYIPDSSTVNKQKPSQSQYERQREKEHCREEIAKGTQLQVCCLITIVIHVIKYTKFIQV